METEHSIDSGPENENLQPQRKKFADLVVGDVQGIQLKNFMLLQDIDNRLNENGLAGGLLEFLGKTDKSLRGLEKELGVGRQVLAKVLDYYGIPRRTQQEASAQVFKNMWQDDEKRQKIIKLSAERIKHYHDNPEMEKKRIESTKTYWKTHPDAIASRSEASKKTWAKPGHREYISELSRERSLKQWSDPQIRERRIQAIREGVKNRVFTDEQRRKISEASKKAWDNPETRQRIMQARLELEKDPEYKASRAEERSNQALRNFHTSEAKEKRAESLRKKWQDPDFRERRTREIRENNQKPEYKQKHLVAMQKLWADPNFREKQSMALREVLENEEYKQHQQAGMNRLWSDPEFRERQAKSARIVLTKLNQETNQLQNAAEGIRKLRAQPESAKNFYLPTIQGYRKDIDYFAQSAWESNVARVLMLKGIEFYAKESVILEVPEKYKHLFKFDITQYTLDFIAIDENDEIVAYDLLVHPLEDPEGYAKVEMFKNQYPHIKLNIIDEDAYMNLKRQFENQINLLPQFCGWETSRDNLRTNPEKYT